MSGRSGVTIRAIGKSAEKHKGAKCGGGREAFWLAILQYCKNLSNIFPCSNMTLDAETRYTDQ